MASKPKQYHIRLPGKYYVGGLLLLLFAFVLLNIGYAPFRTGVFHLGEILRELVIAPGDLLTRIGQRPTYYSMWILAGILMTFGPFAVGGWWLWSTHKSKGLEIRQEEFDVPVSMWALDVRPLEYKDVSAVWTKWYGPLRCLKVDTGDGKPRTLFALWFQSPAVFEKYQQALRQRFRDLHPDALRQGRLRQKKREQYDSAPVHVTAFLSVTLVVAFIVQMAISGQVGPFSTYEMFDVGAAIFPLPSTGDFPRFLLSIFLHKSLLHFGLNLTVFLVVGRILEKYIGSRRYTFIICLSILSSMLIDVGYAVWLEGVATSAGFSGVVMAVIGSLLVLQYVKSDEMLGFLRMSSRTLILITIPFIVPTTSSGGTVSVDHWSHFAGLLTGVIVTYLSFRQKSLDAPTTGLERATLGVSLSVICFTAGASAVYLPDKPEHRIEWVRAMANETNVEHEHPESFYWFVYSLLEMPSASSRGFSAFRAYLRNLPDEGSVSGRKLEVFDREFRHSSPRAACREVLGSEWSRELHVQYNLMSSRQLLQFMGKRLKQCLKSGVSNQARLDRGIALANQLLNLGASIHIDDPALENPLRNAKSWFFAQTAAGLEEKNEKCDILGRSLEIQLEILRELEGGKRHGVEPTIGRLVSLAGRRQQLNCRSAVQPICFDRPDINYTDSAVQMTHVRDDYMSLLVVDDETPDNNEEFEVLSTCLPPKTTVSISTGQAWSAEDVHVVEMRKAQGCNPKKEVVRIVDDKQMIFFR